ncbi:unnamed protein product, partial [Heterotrigona itama]
MLSEIKEHIWLTNCGAESLPSEADNCQLPVTVTDEEVERVVTKIPKLVTLILIKTMLRQHSFHWENNECRGDVDRKEHCKKCGKDFQEQASSRRVFTISKQTA